MRWQQLEQLFKTNSHRLYLVAMAVTRHQDMAEDAVHEALMAMAESKAAPDNPEAYMYQVVRNKALRAIKDRKRYVRAQPETFLTSTSDSHADRFFAVQVSQKLNSLTAEQRETIILHIYGELTFREIAEICGSSPNTVASWYRRGIAALQKGVSRDE